VWIQIDLAMKAVPIVEVAVDHEDRRFLERLERPAARLVSKVLHA
jgi:hypothetical protein